MLLEKKLLKKHLKLITYIQVLKQDILFNETVLNTQFSFQSEKSF